MIKDVLQSLDYSLCAEVALVLFLGSFVGVLVQTFLLHSEESARIAGIPLTDGVKGASR